RGIGERLRVESRRFFGIAVEPQANLVLGRCRHLRLLGRSLSSHTDHPGGSRSVLGGSSPVRASRATFRSASSVVLDPPSGCAPNSFVERCLPGKCDFYRVREYLPRSWAPL